MRGLLRYLGEDPKREGLLDTPARVVRAMGEHFSGYAMDPAVAAARDLAPVDAPVDADVDAGLARLT